MSDVVRAIEELKARRQALVHELASLDQQLQRAKLAVFDALKEPLPASPSPKRTTTQYTQYNRDSATAQRILAHIAASPRALTTNEVRDAFNTTAGRHLTAMYQRSEILRRPVKAAYGGMPAYLYAVREAQFEAVIRNGVGVQPYRFPDAEDTADPSRRLARAESDPDPLVSGTTADEPALAGVSE